MFDSFLKPKEEAVLGGTAKIFKDLGPLLEITVEDREVISSGKKLKFPDDQAKQSFNQALDLLSSGTLSDSDKSNLQELVTAIDGYYEVGI